MKQETLCELVVAIMAVNNYPLERAWGLKESLEREGLLSVERLSTASHEEIYDALTRIGCQRSDYVRGLITQRLQGAARYLQKNPDLLEKAATVRSQEEALRLLDPLPGVGPRVVESFLLLHSG